MSTDTELSYKESLAVLREESLFCREVAVKAGYITLAAIAQDIHDETGELLLNLAIERSK